MQISAASATSTAKVALALQRESDFVASTHERIQGRYIVVCQPQETQNPKARLTRAEQHRAYGISESLWAHIENSTQYLDISQIKVVYAPTIACLQTAKFLIRGMRNEWFPYVRNRDDAKGPLPVSCIRSSKLALVDPDSVPQSRLLQANLVVQSSVNALIQELETTSGQGVRILVADAFTARAIEETISPIANLEKGRAGLRPGEFREVLKPRGVELSWDSGLIVPPR